MILIAAPGEKTCHFEPFTAYPSTDRIKAACQGPDESETSETGLNLELGTDGIASSWHPRNQGPTTSLIPSQITEDSHLVEASGVRSCSLAGIADGREGKAIVLPLQRRKERFMDAWEALVAGPRSDFPRGPAAGPALPARPWIIILLLLACLVPRAVAAWN